MPPMSLSPKCSCCHEAGHAVAWVVNGDQLVLVVGRTDANLTPEQESLRNESIIGAGGSTVEVINQLFRARRSGGATIRRGARSSCKDCKNSVFTETCPACMKTLTQHLACIFAGGAATAHLLPNQHAATQLSDDLAQVDDLLQRALTDEERRKCLCDQAKQKAQELIKRESEAVQKLASELLVRGVVDGSEAEQIIRSNLQILSF
jgi:hypothetical protein